MHLTGRFEVADGDPVQLVESEWQHLRTEAGEEGWPQYRALIEAAYAEPLLRRLYPFTSHWTLRFSTRTRPHFAVIAVTVDALRDDRYSVRASYLDEVIAVFHTAEEAVAAAVQQLPVGIGPVTSGWIEPHERSFHPRGPDPIATWRSPGGPGGGTQPPGATGRAVWA